MAAVTVAAGAIQAGVGVGIPGDATAVVATVTASVAQTAGIDFATAEAEHDCEQEHRAGERRAILPAVVRSRAGLIPDRHCCVGCLSFHRCVSSMVIPG